MHQHGPVLLPMCTRRYLKFIALRDPLKVLVLHSWGFIGRVCVREREIETESYLEPMWLPAWGIATKMRQTAMESCNENAAIVMAIEMKVAASWPVGQLSSWAIWPVGLLVTSSKFACNRSNGSCLYMVCVPVVCLLCGCVCVCVEGSCKFYKPHTRTHTEERNGNWTLNVDIQRTKLNKTTVQKSS